MNWQRMHAAATIGLLRTVLIALNTIFLVSGAILFLLAIVIHDQFSNLQTIAPQMSAGAPYIIIALGAFIFFIGLFALWCTIRSNLTFLSIYACLLLLIFLAEIFLSVGFFTRRQKFENSFKAVGQSLMRNYPFRSLSKQIDQLQSGLSCCGVESYKDWLNTPFGNSSKEVPQSCCKSILDPKCHRKNLQDESQLDEINIGGCYSRLVSLMKQHYPVIGTFLIVIALVPLISALLTIALIKQLTKHRYEKVNQS